ncbi:MAG: hypothetical protein ACI9TY_000656 [Alphaproteobacteria bacterium]|jgi:hypothetical protein
MTHKKSGKTCKGARRNAANKVSQQQQDARNLIAQNSRPFSKDENAKIEKALELAGLGPRSMNTIVMDEIGKQGLDKAIENAVVFPNESFKPMDDNPQVIEEDKPQKSALNIVGVSLLAFFITTGIYGAYQHGLITWVTSLIA